MTPDQLRRMRMRRMNLLMAYASFASTKAVTAWTPSELFAASEQGAWYDPSDFSTMFQDSVGTTPVTAVEQNVGLVLDKSKGLVLGSELMPATDASDWTPVASNTVTDDVDGSVLVTFVDSQFGATLSLSTLVPATANVSKTFKITYEVKVNTGSALVRVLNFVANTTNGPIITATEYVTHTFIGSWDGSGGIDIGFNNLGAGEAINIRNISVKELPGNHASQSSSGSRPVLRATDRLDFDGSDDKLTAAASGAGTTGFLFVAGINLDTVGANQTIWSDTGTNTGYRVRINASNQVQLEAGNGSAYTTVTTTETVSATTNYVIAAWHDGTNLNVKLGTDGDVAQEAFATATAGSASFTVGMDNGAVSSQLNGKIYNAIYVKNFAGSLADVNNAITYVNGTLA